MKRWAWLVVAAAMAGCGAAKPMEVAMAPLPVQAPGGVLENNHFQRDRSGQVSEDALREILAAPTFLEEGARIGIVPVATGYEVEDGLPLATVPQVLGDKLEDTGFFEVATEMTTDWPADGSIRGLRELGARYRTEYLLLYRHRFVDRWYLNGWAWTWPTVVGLFAAPSYSLEAAGVVEATLFEVKTGTLLFTVFERVEDDDTVNIWHHDRKRRKLEEALLSKAAEKLAKQVVAKVDRLVAARPPSTDATAAARPVAAQ
jgi:hypothetical protein